MCFHSQQTKEAQALEHRFNARFVHPETYTPAVYNAFAYPSVPVITSEDVHSIQMYRWGLIPAWAEDVSVIKFNTLNARIEGIREKPSFRDYIQNRCLVLADGFYEWQWLDSAGKKKQRYLLQLPDAEPFGFAGLFNHWTDKSTGEVLHTFTIITTEANALMATIHNSKKRMPVIVRPSEELTWLSSGKLFIQNDRIEAIPC